MLFKDKIIEWVKEEIDVAMIAYKINKISEKEKDRYIKHLLFEMFDAVAKREDPHDSFKS